MYLYRCIRDLLNYGALDSIIFADHLLNWRTRRLFDNYICSFRPVMQVNTLLPLYLSARNERTHAMDNKWRNPFVIVSPPEVTDFFFFFFRGKEVGCGDLSSNHQSGILLCKYPCASIRICSIVHVHTTYKYPSHRSMQHPLHNLICMYHTEHETFLF